MSLLLSMETSIRTSWRDRCRVLFKLGVAALMLELLVLSWLIMVRADEIVSVVLSYESVQKS